MSGNLTTLANVKTLIQMPSGDTSQDALISLLISSVSAQVETYCNRQFGYADYIETLASNNRQLLQLQQWPVNNVAYVKQSGNVLVSGQDYQVYPQYLDCGQLYRGPGWTGSSWVRGLTADPYTGEYIYEASYMAGYVLPGATPPISPLTAPALPADLQLCAMQMVAKVYTLSMSGNLGENLNSITEGGLSYSWDNPAKIPTELFSIIAGMPVQFATLLNPYKKWSVA
jgi:hypothetical protein